MKTIVAMLGLGMAFGCAGSADDLTAGDDLNLDVVASRALGVESATRSSPKARARGGESLTALVPRGPRHGVFSAKDAKQLDETFCCETTHLKGGKKDCFAAPEDAATLVDVAGLNPIESYLTSHGIPQSKRSNYDTTLLDKFLVQTIKFGYAASTIDAACKFGLNVRMRVPPYAAGYYPIPANDTLTILVFDAVTQTWQTPYSQVIGWTGASAPTTKFIDLKPLANQVGGKDFINVLIQDDTFVDYIELVQGQSSPVECPPVPPAPTYTTSSSWHVAIEENAMLTSCGAQTNIPVGAATNCPDAITAAQALFNPAIADCLKASCKTWLEAANPGLVIGSLADVSVVEVAPSSCWADPYTTVMGYARTRYQVTLPFECHYSVPVCID